MKYLYLFIWQVARDIKIGWFKSVLLIYEKLKNVRLQRFIWSQWLSYIAAGVFAITSITYAPEVMSGKSRCRVFSSFANLEGEKRDNKALQSFKVPQKRSHKWQHFLVFKQNKCFNLFIHIHAQLAKVWSNLHWSESHHSHTNILLLCVCSP